MPYKEKSIEKLYYSIGEVSEILGVPVSTVRFWENEFDALRPMKNKKGNRMFTSNDIKNLKIIKDELFSHFSAYSVFNYIKVGVSRIDSNVLFYCPENYPLSSSFPG